MFIVGSIIQIFVSALILKLILFLIARHEADTSLIKAMFVVMGITIGNTIIMGLCIAKGPIFFLLGLLLCLAFITAVIMTSCWISWVKSLVVVVLFSFAHFCMSFIIALVCLGSVAAIMAPRIGKLMPGKDAPHVIGPYGAPGPNVSPEVMKMIEEGQAQAGRASAETQRRQAEIRDWQRAVEQGIEPPAPGDSNPRRQPVPAEVKTPLVPKQRTAAPGAVSDGRP